MTFKAGLTTDIRNVLTAHPDYRPKQIFEELLKQDNPVQFHSQPLASIWSVWKRIKEQESRNGE